MESATRAVYRVVSSTSTRWRPSRWLWTATTCLVAVTGPASRVSGPLVSALTIRSIGGSSSSSGSSRSYQRGLSATGSSEAANLASGSFTTHSSLSELLKEFDYDALILDQFGVLHNGKDALEGTIDCVETIALGKKNDADADDATQKKLQLIVLSNTSSPASTTLDRLHTKLGFDRSYFCGAVTSGEEAGRHIRETYGNNSNNKQKRKFVWCTWDVTNENVPDPNAFLDLCGSNVEPTVDVSSADFVVAHGSGAIRGFGKNSNGETQIISMGSFLDDGNLGTGTPINALLEECADRNLPLVCANPDMVVQYHDGSLKHMPGKIAQRYKEILEEQRSSNDDDDAPSPPSITIYGKPHTEHFEACLRELEENNTEKEPLKVAHVGDSLHHDIAGANASGVPSIFIVGGIHAEELLSDNDSKSKMPSETKLKEFFDKEGITPTHVLSVFNY
jgi:ribonucleotide monophosphatase NagD (HAD superfamily)